MRLKALAVVILLIGFPAAFYAQETVSKSVSSIDESKLTETQKKGQLVFQQRCSVCHTLLTLTNHKTYGPRLYKDLVDGNEDFIRQTIMNGREGLMPGFKYGLTQTEITDIIEFLKVIPKPAQQSSWY